MKHDGIYVYVCSPRFLVRIRVKRLLAGSDEGTGLGVAHSGLPSQTYNFIRAHKLSPRQTRGCGPYAPVACTAQTIQPIPGTGDCTSPPRRHGEHSVAVSRLSQGRRSHRRLRRSGVYAQAHRDTDTTKIPTQEFADVGVDTEAAAAPLKRTAETVEMMLELKVKPRRLRENAFLVVYMGLSEAPLARKLFLWVRVRDNWNL